MSFEKLTAVSVDDNLVNLMLVEALSREMSLDVKSFANPLEALEYIKDDTHDVDLIFVDYMMPEMHGVEFIENVRKLHSDIPIIMITAVSDDNELKLHAIEAGATEFLNKPLNPVEFKARVKNISELRKAQLLVMDKALLLQHEVDKAVAEVKEREFEALDVLGRAAEYKDPETGAHTLRVAKYSKMIAGELGLSEDEQELLLYAAPLHDVGKIGIPDNILMKTGSLTNDEFELMKTHTYKGYIMLKDARSEYLRAGAMVAFTHHEKFDGSGYPSKLSGEDIHIFGRIVALADVFDAVTSRRPYKEPWPLEKALALLQGERGRHFDPKVVDAFFKNINLVEKILQG